MPAPRPTLTIEAARRVAAASGFDTDCPTGVGVELEWLVVRDGDANAPAPFDAVRDAVFDATLGELPGASRITFEPGGQVELSAPPAASVDNAIATAAADAAVLFDRLAAAGFRAVALGLDPARPRRRVLDTPRYRAMAEYFHTGGSAGASMMCATAALQVNVGLGRGAEAAARWHVAHDLGPVLTAAFAHSPLCGRRPSGWRSSRAAVWSAIDPTRTKPVQLAPAPNPRAAWADYALSARVMLVRVSERDYVPMVKPMTFAEWIRDGHPIGHPTEDDLAYHLTTLFPPVRPRGWLELRMFDALPDPWWRVATAVTVTLLTDARTRSVVTPVLGSTRGRWLDAALRGLREPALADAALVCFDRALDGFDRAGVDDRTREAAAEYRDRYVVRGRTPADDRLDEWAATGALLPAAEPVPEPTWS